MIKDLLLLGSIVCVGVGYFKLFLVSWNSKKNSKEITGFEIAKDITASYDEINIVESKKLVVSQYDVKRNVIRLIPQNYDDSTDFSLVIASLLAGYSLLRVERDKYFKILKRILPSISWLPVSGILAVMIAFFTNTIQDAWIGIVLFLFILFYQYLMIQINLAGFGCVEKVLEKKLFDSLKGLMEVFISSYKVMFLSTLVLMLRNVLIILGMG